MKKIITIAQRKGGVGKTTIAAQLLVAFSRKGLKVAAIDIDPQGSLTYWHNLRETKFGKNFTCIEFMNVPGWKVSSEIARLRLTHDLIIIDSPPHNETDSKAAIRAADLVLIPLQASPTDLWATQETIEFSKKEHKKFYLILNRLQHNSKMAKLITDKLPKKILKNNLGNRVSFSSCMFNGSSVLENEPISLASDEIRNLCEEVYALLNNETALLKEETLIC